ncbi:MAG: T9SS type A sorting domain-containing protein [Flavobacterium sp.]|nr:MAG: T9SS type A sorting domain-containing protein [Flavobacterium sp.]
MKNSIKLFLLIISVTAYPQQPQTMRVNGQVLTTVSGQAITLRGINYPIIDQGEISLANPVAYQHKIDQAALTGANAIRLPWYTNGTHWRDNPDFGGPNIVSGYVNNGHLSDIIGYCHLKGMIPILEIHNVTCSDNWTAFNNVVMPWWKSQVVLNLIEEHKEYLIINLANEFGTVRWTNNAAANLTTFKNNYNTAIASMRALGVNVPIMIDAPDCGQSSTELLSIAPGMVVSDPQNNLIFSAHAYWAAYAETLPAIEQELDEADAANVHFILGEVASTQDGNSCGSISLATIYPMILEEACSRNIGWLAWTYTLDCSSGRQMTTNGEYNTLTAYGSDLVNNPVYGLKSTGGCGATALTTKSVTPKAMLKLYPNPASNQFSIEGNKEIVKATVYDIAGRKLKEVTSGFDAIDVTSLQSGGYIVQVKTEGGTVFSQKLIKN